MSKRNGARWAAVTASVRGASHDRTGMPNQDAVRTTRVDGPVPGLVAAVADGHGGARYVRSDVGSRLGVEVACEVAAVALVELGENPDAKRIERQLSGQVVEAIVAQWRERVLAHLAEQPFTEEEAQRAGAPLDGDPLISYGATLILALLGPNWVGLLQIGDGDATIVTGDTVGDPVPGDDRLVGGETTSLCLPTAVSDARVAALVGPLPDLVVLTSDGYANSFASPSWRADAGLDLRNHVRRDGLADVAKKLPSWLADSAVAGGDDVSMALLQRSDQPAGAPVAAAAPTAAAGNGGGTTPPAGRSGGTRRAALIAVGVVALILGVAAGVGGGYALFGDDDTTAASTATSTSPPTTTSTSTSTTLPLPNAVLAVPVGDEKVELIGFQPFPTASSPRVIGSADAFEIPLDLPDTWELENGNLVWDGDRSGTKRPALAAVVIGPNVWAADGTTLSAYALVDGKKAGDGAQIVRPSSTVAGSGGPKTAPTPAPTSPNTTAKTATQPEK